MELYTGLIPFSLTWIFSLVNLALLILIGYIIYLIITNLQLSKKLLAKKLEEMENDSFKEESTIMKDEKK